MVSNVPLPIPGENRVLFTVENCLLSVEAPPKDGLPHVEVWTLFISCVLLSFAHMIEKLLKQKLSLVNPPLFYGCRYHFSLLYSA